MPNSDYVLSPDVLNKVRTTSKLRLQLMNALRCSETELDHWIENNDPGSKLTNIKAVNVLQIATGIPPVKLLVLVSNVKIEQSPYLLPDKRKSRVSQ